MDKKLFIQSLNSLKSGFTADLRSLALLRICLSLLIIYDLFVRWADSAAFFSNQGVYPLQIARGFNPFLLSFFYLNDSWFFHSFLFVLTLLSTIFLGLGYKTRLVSITTWVLLLSIHNRNILLNDGGDNITLLVLFWGMFLPWGIRYSLDSFSLDLKSIPNKIINFATVALFIQVGIIYLSAVIQKRSDVWLTQGSGVYYALSIHHFETPFGHFLLQFPVLLFILNYLVLLTELLAPFALFWPSKNNIFRTFSILILISMHLGFGLSLTLGVFTFVMSTVLLGLLPSWFWDNIKNVKFPKLNPFHLRKKPSSYKSHSPDLKQPLFIKYLISALIIYIILVDLLTFYPLGPQFRSFYQLNKVLSLSQDWQLFGPKPYDYGLWFVTAGKLKNGEDIDVLTGGKPSFSKPEYASNSFKNYRWRNFLDKMHAYKQSFDPFANYLCNEWNQKNSQKLESIEVYSLILENPEPWDSPPNLSSLQNTKISNQDPVVEREKQTTYKCLNR